MGWGRFLALGNVGLFMDIESMSAKLRTLQAKARLQGSQEESLLQLQKRVHDLELRVTLLLRLLAQKETLSEEELLQLTRHLDAGSEESWAGKAP
jgi:hypothetical protein